jgi:peptidoglycan/LPS O-acetylase OafA/YrhL
VTTAISISHYSKDYFMRKFKRIIIPGVIVFVVSLLIGITTRQDYYLGILSLVGVMPTHAAGNYFLSMAIQFIILAPLMYAIYSKCPNLLVMGSFCLTLFFELAYQYLPQSQELQTLYAFCILRYLFTISLGFTISDMLIRNDPILSKKYATVLLFIPFSVLYLLISITYPMSSFGYNLFSSGYALLLAILVFKSPIKGYIKNKSLHYISLIGKASYHIYLVQMIYFGVIPITLFTRYVTQQNVYSMGVVVVIVDIFITVGFGIIFYYVMSPSFRHNHTIV